jgi:hypothetical protein
LSILIITLGLLLNADVCWASSLTKPPPSVRRKFRDSSVHKVKGEKESRTMVVVSQGSLNVLVEVLEKTDDMFEEK